MQMDETLALMNEAQQPCQHKQIRRYGNRHGSFAKCQECGKSWKWSEDLEKWVDPMPSKRQPLQLPASSNSINRLKR